MSDKIKFTLNGSEVEAAPDETIWQVAKRQGVEIPHLCYSPKPGYRADGNCRACMVEIEGERVLAASCIRMPTEGMTVLTASERAISARDMVFEMLLADQPPPDAAHEPGSLFWDWAGKMGVMESRFPARAAPVTDARHDGQPGRLHPLHPLRPRLPRGPGQRRHRHGRARRGIQDRL